MRYLLLAAVAVLTLSGCGGESEAAAAKPSQSPESAYIAQLEETVPTYVVEPKRDRLVEVGYDVCQTIENGRLSEPDIVSAVTRTEGLETAHAEALVWAAHDNFCPDLDL